MRNTQSDGETGQLTVGNNTDHTESQRKQEMNTVTADNENEQENGERGKKKYHVTNICLGATGHAVEENADQVKKPNKKPQLSGH